jgi:predicted nucleotide-binding protein
MHVDTERKIALLDDKIAEANDGRPADFNVWRETTGVVLRNVLGDAHPLYEAFSKVRYSLSAYTSATPRSAFDQARVAGVNRALSILKAAKLEVELNGGSPQPDEGAVAGAAGTGTGIFIVHGRDDARKHEVARLIRALTGNEPIILHEQANGGRTIIEKFEEYAASTAYAVVLVTGDDVGRGPNDTEDRKRARQNVIFELGFFFGALGRARVAALYDEEVEQPSDTDGIVRVPLDAGGGWKLILAREMSAAGVGIDWSALK